MTCGFFIKLHSSAFTSSSLWSNCFALHSLVFTSFHHTIFSFSFLLDFSLSLSSLLFCPCCFALHLPPHFSVWLYIPIRHPLLSLPTAVHFDFLIPLHPADCSRSVLNLRPHPLSFTLVLGSSSSHSHRCLSRYQFPFSSLCHILYFPRHTYSLRYSAILSLSLSLSLFCSLSLPPCFQYFKRE